ncbi:putative Ppic-type ppiase domain protein [Candidatus Sulfobium mesophilum]|uniref:peptidylprolyl isomerase n=1 Tax=Candidatus Sulfobium mesophilum TaxID=2016548 RepID=A0A2U3QE59_9BACT|nr:putative Ppic-type ppiase domain protein [Candidatus Sulfobium mesophilum]
MDDRYFSKPIGNNILTFLNFFPFFAFLTFLNFFPFSSFAWSEEKDIVARVGDAVITAPELENALQKYVPPGSMHGSMDPSKKEKYRKNALNDLVEVELLYHEAKSRGMKASKDAVDKAVEENMKRLGSEKKLKNALKKDGMTLDSYREKLGKYEMANAVVAAVVKETEYSEEELKDYYEKNKERYKKPEAMQIWHILVQVDPSASEEEWLKKRDYALQLYQKIKDGEDFRSVAYKYSEEAWKVKEGDLGILHRGQLEQEIEDVAFSLKEGEVSQPIRTYSGFHIVKAGERKPETQLSFEDAKNRLRDELHEKRFKEKMAALFERLRGKYPVKIYLNNK